MGALLAGMSSSRILGYLCAIVCLSLRGGTPASQAANGASLTKEDGLSFMAEAYLAKQRCDDQWFQTHLTPDAKLIFEIRDEGPRVVTREDYLKTFHQYCRYPVAPPFYDKANTSVETRRGSVTIRQRLDDARASILVSLYGLEARDLDWLEQTIVFIRVGGMIKADRVQILGIPTAQPPTTGNSRPRP